MPIYQAVNELGYTISIVAARNRKSANAYWQGAGKFPHKVIKVEYKKLLKDKMIGVIPLLKTKERLIPSPNKPHNFNISMIYVEK